MHFDIAERSASVNVANNVGKLEEMYRFTLYVYRKNSAASGYPDQNERKPSHHTTSHFSPHMHHASRFRRARTRTRTRTEHTRNRRLTHSNSASAFSLSTSYLPASNLLLRHPLCLNLSILSLSSSFSSPAVPSLENDPREPAYDPRKLENDARKSGEEQPPVGELASGVERPEEGSGFASSERTAAMCAPTCVRRSSSTAA